MKKAKLVFYDFEDNIENNENDEEEIDEENDKDENDDEEDDLKEEATTIKRGIPFYQYYKEIATSVLNELEAEETNENLVKKKNYLNNPDKVAMFVEQFLYLCISLDWIYAS